ncbi:chromodomain-helicase-DNA-binding protein 1 [Fusarium proliferatum]|nr:chromodomain-helicase-DNA-binding protein 1 [Fusarium proliferatum]CVL12397.1 uncharacterized protein FPRN_03603 [Fusarium proliferatum]
MSNSPQMLDQVTRGRGTGGGIWGTRSRSLPPSEANAPAVSPNVAIERPKLSFPVEPLLDKWESGYGSTLNSTKVNKTEVNDKTNVSSAGISRDNFPHFTDVKVDDMNLKWDEIIPADRLAEIKAEEQQKKEEAYIGKTVVEDAPRKAAIKSRNRIKVLGSLPKKLQIGEREMYKKNSLPPRSAEAGPGNPPPQAHGLIPSHRNTDKLLDFRLWSTHYTISQDHTSGKEAHEDKLLASFGKRRHTEKPSISLGGSRLFQRSPNLLSSLANDNDVVAQDKWHGTQVISTEDLDPLGDWQPVESKIPEATVSFPQETAITKPNEGRYRRDKVEFEWVRNKERRPVQSRPEIPVPRSQQSFRADTSRVNKSGDGPQATLQLRCHSCNRSDGSAWRRGPDGARTLCNACGLHYAKLQRKRMLQRNRVLS